MTTIGQAGYHIVGLSPFGRNALGVLCLSMVGAGMLLLGTAIVPAQERVAPGAITGTFFTPAPTRDSTRMVGGVVLPYTEHLPPEWEVCVVTPDGDGCLTLRQPPGEWGANGRAVSVGYTRKPLIGKFNVMWIKGAGE